MVPGLAGVQSFVLQVGPSTGGLVCHQVQSQAPQVCVTGSGSKSLGSGRSESVMGESRRVCFSSGISSQPGGFQDGGSGLSQNDPRGTGVAWFWDLVNLSVQVPFQLPLQKDLVSQPFNGVLHRNLSSLNLHAWLLEPVPSRNKVLLRKWQQELRLLRDSQPEPCTSQSGPFLLNGATRIRWTSGCPL